ncbi:Rieske 2Fe-2S domain-containing protein [Streptomyces cinnamoneus]|uniref:Rieske 2Fe-2S domain-containing protein n=1 Tax=Streptomyces cinnamoneus TaxID=53446 RepID=UPI00340DFA7E
MPRRQRRRPRPYDQVLHDLLLTENGREQPLCPTGWYFARFSKHLGKGEVVPVTYMNRQYALFRTDTGRVGMIDSQCCHMGADLARCGVVREENLACGYHAWEFDTAGRCRNIPGATRIPSRAGQRGVPVTERGGRIWFWHGPQPPEPLTHLDFAQDRRRYTCLPGEVTVCHADLLPVSEHVTDVAHWPYVHKASVPMTVVTVRDEGRHFSYRVQPAEGHGQRIQRFHPYATVTMAGPTSAVITPRTDPRPGEKPPRFTVVTAMSPVRPGVTVTAWSVIVRTLRPGWLLWPVNRLMAGVIWRVVRRNSRADRDILRWMRPVAKDLWSSADGPSVRAYRRFYQRNLPADAQ